MTPADELERELSDVMEVVAMTGRVRHQDIVHVIDLVTPSVAAFIRKREAELVERCARMAYDAEPGVICSKREPAPNYAIQRRIRALIPKADELGPGGCPCTQCPAGEDPHTRCAHCCPYRESDS